MTNPIRGEGFVTALKRFAAPFYGKVPADSGSSHASAPATLAESDFEFFEDAAQAGMAEVQAAAIASSRAWDAKIKTFASKMTTEHLDSNERLGELARKKGVQLPTQLDTIHQWLLDGLQHVDTKKLDAAYVWESVKGHKHAIETFETAAENSKDADIKNFAARMLPRLRQHLAAANQLSENR